MRGRAFEQPAAAAREQRVAAEQQRRTERATAGFEEGDVARGVTRDVDDLEAPAEQLDAVAVVQRLVRSRDGLAPRAEHLAAQPSAQRIDAADMIAVMVGH